MINNELEFINFFGSNPKFFDYEALLLEYVSICMYNLNFKLYRNVYEDYASISLIGTLDNSFDFNIGIDNISEIKITDNELNIIFSNGGNCLIIKDLIFKTILKTHKLKNFELLPIKYDKIDFLELFCDFPKIIDEKNNLLQYNSFGLKEFSISLILNINNNEIELLITHMISNIQVFKTKIYNVEKIETKIQKDIEALFIHTKDNTEPFEIQFRPIFKFRTSIS